MVYPETSGGEGAIEIGWIKDPRVRAEAKPVVEAAHFKTCRREQSALLLQKLNQSGLGFQSALLERRGRLRFTGVGRLSLA